jgi:hypothetical protein
MNPSKEENAVQMPKDMEAVKILLEGAEIDYTENEDRSGRTSFELDSGVTFYFDEEGRLFEVR